MQLRLERSEYGRCISAINAPQIPFMTVTPGIMIIRCVQIRLRLYYLSDLTPMVIKSVVSPLRSGPIASFISLISIGEPGGKRHASAFSPFPQPFCELKTLLKSGDLLSSSGLSGASHLFPFISREMLSHPVPRIRSPVRLHMLQGLGVFHRDLSLSSNLRLGCALLLTCSNASCS